jgi:guanylate kinase
VRKQGKICILDIDIQGVKNVKNSNLDCRYAFIMPPSVQALEQRLRDRATETEEKIKVRMANSTAEIQVNQTSSFQQTRTRRASKIDQRRRSSQSK